MRLLIAEDDPGMRSVLERGLQRDGYVVDTCASGDDALHLLAVNEYAVAILDWRMPAMSGVDVVAAARRAGIGTPILMLTARDTAGDRVEGLDSGADDYLVKPFDLGELRARLRALMRRRPGSVDPVLRAASLALDPATRVTTVNGRAVALTPRETAILEVLLRRAPAVVSRAAIATQVWDDEGESIGANAIEVHIARLRAKLAGSGVQLAAVRGSGYRVLAR